MARGRASVYVGAVGLMAAWLLSGSAHAEETDAAQERFHRASEILKHVETHRSADPTSPIPHNVTIAKGYGLQYLHRFEIGERGLQFRVRGPVFRAATRQKNLGISVELRF